MVFLMVEKQLSEQFDDRLSDVASRGGYVFKTASERIIMADGSVIDPEPGINHCGDIFGIDRPVFRPPRLLDVPGVVGRLAKDTAPLNTSACDQSRMHKIVIASLLACDVPDSSSELAFCDDQCLVEFASAVTSRNDSKVGNEIGEASVELAR